ncbi:MAG: T9SS type A sorting domain-containing protein [Flavobacteriales bacterium]|nr:T9SS type A sorting domain-containing protein [Flavobacteriales bacterium]
MRHLLLLSVIAFTTLNLNAQIDVLSVESVDYSEKYDTYYFSKKSNQTIQKMDASNVVTDLGTATGVQGIEVVGDTLWACAGGSVKGYLLPDGELVATIDLGGSDLNGMTHYGNDLYISDWSQKKIFHINLLTLIGYTYVTGIPKSPNGIIYDDYSDRLVFVTWGNNASIYEIDMADSSYTVALTTTLGKMDGIAIDCDGDFYISTWSPVQISKVPNDFSSAPADIGATGIAKPADIYYNRLNDSLAIANAGNNTVSFEHLPSCTVGIEDIAKAPVASIWAYRNTINIEGNGNATIFNLMGQKIHQSKVNGRSAISLSKGIYFVKVSSESRNTTRKVYVE